MTETRIIACVLTRKKMAGNITSGMVNRHPARSPKSRQMTMDLIKFFALLLFMRVAYDLGCTKFET